MKKILVPTDFSANANKALDLAVQIAKEAKAEILLIHACDLVDTTFKDHLTIKKEYNQSIEDRANKSLSLLKKSVEDKEPVTVHTSLYNGFPVDSILTAAEDNGVDFIIIGTRGEMPLSESLLGSTTSGVIGKTKVPVMVVSPLVNNEGGRFTPDAILFATNHFEENKALLNPIVEVAKLFASTIHVVVFVDTDVAEGYDYVYNIKELNHYLEFLKSAYPGVSFKAELLEGERFAETIEKYNDKNGVDIIAMITYPKTFWEKLLKKRMTKEMAFHSKVPVIAITGK
jgi:nucleotide-binding universal stress UspA family protein